MSFTSGPSFNQHEDLKNHNGPLLGCSDLYRVVYTLFIGFISYLTGWSLWGTIPMALAFLLTTGVVKVT